MSRLDLSGLSAGAQQLKPAPFTVVTQRDGTRFMEHRDGTRTELALELNDENGKWAVLDEMAATGVSGEYEPTGAADEEGVSAAEAVSAALGTLVQQHPELGEHAKLLGIGVPATAVIARVKGAFGEALAHQFKNALDNVGLDADGLGAAADEVVELRGTAAERHGLLGDPTWAAPKVATRCGEIARPGYNSGRAHEYLDDPDVLRAKVALLATMLRQSRRTVLYAGAGLSTSAGISDYASRAGEGGLVARRRQEQQEDGAQQSAEDKAAEAEAQGFRLSPMAARPSAGHKAIAHLGREGLLYRFIQQNHDGLPQKAGMPQAMVNEIHGGWFDPTNPVVAMSGNLRADLFDDLLNLERTADLVLTLGSSLCGMNADRVVATCAHRAKARRVGHEGDQAAKMRTNKDGRKYSLGSVIVSLQQTPHDANSSVRIFALIDDVMELLVQELGHDAAAIMAPSTRWQPPAIPDEHRPLGPDVDVFAIPYAADGTKLPADATRHHLDMREGAEVLLTVGPQQGQRAVVIGRNADGHWRIRVDHSFHNNPKAKWTETRLLGNWWLSELVAGTVDLSPIATPPPATEGEAGASEAEA